MALMALFWAEYKDANTDYTGQGVDQIADVIDKLNNKPYDRHYPECIEPRRFEEDSSFVMPHVRSILRLISTSIVYKVVSYGACCIAYFIRGPVTWDRSVLQHRLLCSTHAHVGPRVQPHPRDIHTYYRRCTRVYIPCRCIESPA